MVRPFVLLTAALVITYTHRAIADIGTDLDLTTPTSITRLYWSNDLKVFEGACEPGSPILRSNCSTSVRQVDKNAFTNIVLKDAKANLTLAEQEFAAPNKIYLAANGRLQDFDATSQERFQIIGEFTQLKQNMAALLLRKEDLLQQISEVEEQLRTHPTDELWAKYNYLEQKLTEVQNQLITTDQNIKDKNTRLKVLEQKLAGFESRDVLLQNIEAAKGPFEKAKAKYDQAKENFDLAGDSLSKVTDSIVYEIPSTNTEFAKNRPWVKNFKDNMDRIQLSFNEGDYSEDYGRSNECIHHLKIINGTTISLSFSGTDSLCKAAGTVTLTCTWGRCEGSNAQIKTIELIKLSGSRMYQANVVYLKGSSSSTFYPRQ